MYLFADPTSSKKATLGVSKLQGVTPSQTNWIPRSQSKEKQSKLEVAERQRYSVEVFHGVSYFDVWQL